MKTMVFAVILLAQFSCGNQRMGSLPKEVIQRVILQNKAQIRHCYEVELQLSPNLAGRIMLKWVIAATGNVTQVQIKESTLTSPAVERCIAAQIERWNFPAPSGGGICRGNVSISHSIESPLHVIEDRTCHALASGDEFSDCHLSCLFLSVIFHRRLWLFNRRELLFHPKPCLVSRHATAA